MYTTPNPGDITMALFSDSLNFDVYRDDSDRVMSGRNGKGFQVIEKSRNKDT